MDQISYIVSLDWSRLVLGGMYETALRAAPLVSSHGANEDLPWSYDADRNWQSTIRIMTGVW